MTISKYEDRALAGDKFATFKLIRMFRIYRAAVISLSNSTRNGHIDSVDTALLQQLFEEVDKANKILKSSGWVPYTARECDLCSNPPTWSHPAGGFRCSECALLKEER